MDISIEKLTKRYASQTAVDQISFSVKKGEILGFLGPNGAGKSTTMKMITGYVGIGEGDILIGGKSVKNHASELKKHIGYLPEHNPLYLEMPVIDYLHFCAALQGVEPSMIQERTRMMIRLTGLQVEKHKKIGELSKGYRQRVGLAQAMIHDPKVLILDEPTSGLDPNQIIEIRQLIREMGKDKTVILSSHILPEVEATCDRILIINKGKIVADGTAEKLRHQAVSSEVIRIKVEDGSADAISRALQSLSSINEVTITDAATNRLQLHCQPGMASRRDIFQLCVQNNWVLSEIVPVETRLEDIFRDLTLN